MENVRFYLNGVAISNSIPSGICEAYDASVALEDARSFLADLQEEMEEDYSSVSSAELTAALHVVASAERRVAALKAEGRI